MTLTNSILKKLNKLHPLKILKANLLNFRKSKVDYSKYLIITGSPRSGTTWLAELISNIPNSILIYEPLHLRKNIYSVEAGFRWRTFINSKDEAQNYYDFFLKMFNFKVLTSWNMKFVPLSKVLDAEYYIFKFVRANMFLEWLTNKFPIKTPVLIIRHPCAIASSRLNIGWDTPFKFDKEFYENFPVFKNIVMNLNTKEEKIAALWCQDYYVPLCQTSRKSFILVCYENLILNPEQEISRIFNEWGVEIPDEINKKVYVASKSFKRNPSNEYLLENKIDAKKLLSKWKSELSIKQISDILNIVKKSGMDFYTEDLEPDYERLYGDKPIRL